MILFTTNLIQKFESEKRESESYLALFEIKIVLLKALLNESNWKRTVATDTRMACFAESAPSSCLTLNSQVQNGLAVYSGDTILFDGTDPNKGYTKDGRPCIGTATVPCHFRPNISWRIACNLTADPTCKAPIVMIDVNFTISNSVAGSINLLAYNFTLNKSTFPIETTTPCAGATPACSVSQQPVCQSDGIWSCVEFSP